MGPESKMTVGELRSHLEGWPDDYEITFGGCLDFYRLKGRGATLVDMEFNQTVYRDDEGKYHIDE